MRSEIDKALTKRPEILAPINAVGEVQPLLEAGAAWLYGGVLPSEWKDKYPSTVLLNQRTFASAQFSSLAEFDEAVRLAHEGGGRFALTLNAPFFMDEQMPAVLDLVRRAVDKKVDAIIAADPGLIAAISRENIRIPLHLSTMGVASNVGAVKMYHRLGVDRIILPRFLDIRQITEMIRSGAQVQYEAFVLVGKCPNVEGVCSFVHDNPDQRWPCEWRWELEGEDGTPPFTAVVAHYHDLERSDRRDGCGLCALPLLVSAGVSSFKVVGRGAPVGRKVQLVRTLHAFLDSLPPSNGSEQESGWRAEWIDECRRVYSTVFGHPCDIHNCYYPDIDGLW